MARIGGRERAYFGWLCREITRPWMPGGNHFDGEALYRSLMPRQYRNRPTGPRGFADDFDLFWTVSNGVFGGETVFSLQLNTAIALGSDALYLAARLHGQCEIHAYILPEDFHWFRTTVEDGIETGVLRPETQGYEGWAGVIELMSGDCGPIVTSYSVTDGFPPWNADADEPGEWGAEFAKLDQSLRISPRRILFNSGKTIMNVLDEARCQHGAPRPTTNT